jgi:tetratricopeptide (TPR) repeat protein
MKSNTLIYTAFGFAFLGLMACGAPEKKTVSFPDQLHALDSLMLTPNGEVKDMSKAQEYIALSEQYAATLLPASPDKFAEVSAKAAGLAVSLSDGEKALSLYNAVAEKTPQQAKAPMALFMTGFVYENLLKDNAKAKAAYELFLQRYPNDPDFADDAQNCLKLLGKTPEEVFQEFEKQNKTPQKAGK